MEMYKLPYVNRWLYEASSLNQVLCENLEWWDGVVGVVEEFQVGGHICTLMADSC